MRALLKHPLIVSLAAAVVAGAIGLLVAVEVGKAKDDEQDRAITKLDEMLSHVKLDGDRTAVDAATTRTRLDAHESRHGEQVRDLTERVQSLDECVRSACWRRRTER